MSGQSRHELAAGGRDHVGTLGVPQRLVNPFGHVPERRDEGGPTEVEEPLVRGDDAGSGVGHDEVRVVAQFVEHQQPCRRVRLRHGPHDAELADRTLRQPPGLGHRQDEKPGVPALLSSFQVAAVDRHVIDKHHLGTLEHLAVLDHGVQPAPLVESRCAQPRLDGFAHHRPEHLDPVSGDVPSVPARLG